MYSGGGTRYQSNGYINEESKNHHHHRSLADAGTSSSKIIIRISCHCISIPLKLTTIVVFELDLDCAFSICHKLDSARRMRSWEGGTTDLIKKVDQLLFAHPFPQLS